MSGSGGGGGSGHNVSITLSADDDASETIRKVSKALETVAKGHDAANHKAAKHGASLWANVKGTAVGTAMGGVITAGMHLGAEAMHKGMEEIKEIFNDGITGIESYRSVTASLMMTDQSGAGYDMMFQKGTLFKDQLEELGIAAGAADAEVQRVFEDIAARSSKSANEVAKLTEQVVYAGRAVPGGAGALAAGFAQMEQGMIRAQNPVVQLIAASHVLKGNAKDVAAQLTKMTPQRAMEFAEKAMENMGEKMKAAPATFGQLITSLKQTKEQVSEAFGIPMVNELIPVLSQVKNFLADNKAVILPRPRTWRRRASRRGVMSTSGGRRSGTRSTPPTRERCSPTARVHSSRRGSSVRRSRRRCGKRARDSQRDSVRRTWAGRT